MTELEFTKINSYDKLANDGRISYTRYTIFVGLKFTKSGLRNRNRSCTSLTSTVETLYKNGVKEE